MKNNVTNNIIDIDKNSNGNLTISSSVVQKLIYGLLTSENYKLGLDDIKIINNSDNDDVEAQIKLSVNKKTNLMNLKNNIINLVLTRIGSVLNINVMNINLIFNVNNE